MKNFGKEALKSKIQLESLGLLPKSLREPF